MSTFVSFSDNDFSRFWPQNVNVAMSLILRIISSNLKAPVTLLVVLLLALVLPVVHLLVKRPRLPKNVPTLLRGWPVVGSVGFYTERFDFVGRIKSKMPNRHFTFFYGRYPIIAMTGETGRSAFFNTRFLDLKSAYESPQTSKKTSLT